MYQVLCTFHAQPEREGREEWRVGGGRVEEGEREEEKNGG